MVCKGIVADHGGAIEVSSAPGQGTEFRVVLPGPDTGVPARGRAAQARLPDSRSVWGK